MSCRKPLEAAVLLDYWVAALAAADEEAVEKHLLACDACGERLGEVAALAQGVRMVARGGALRMVASDVFLQRVAEEGLRVREYAPPPGGSVQCTVTAEDDFLVGHLAANFESARRVDLSLCDGDGVEWARMADIPFQRAAGSVAFQHSIASAKAAPSGVMIARLMAVDDAGGERMLGEYTFHHERTLPGPGAW